MPNYEGRIEKDIWGSDKVVVRKTTSGEDIAGAGIDLAFAAVRTANRAHQNAKIGRAQEQLDHAFALSEHEQYQEAVEVINRVMRQYPQEPFPVYNRGHVYLTHAQNATGTERQELCDRAVADFNMAERLSAAQPMDDSSAIPYWRGCAHLLIGAMQAALSDANMAVRRAPHDAANHQLKARVMRELDDYEQALMSVQQSLQIETDATGYQLRGELYFDMGDYAKAAADITRVITLEGPDPVAYASRAACYERLGENDKALADLAQSIALDPLDADYYALRADIYREMGQNEAADAEMATLAEKQAEVKQAASRATEAASLNAHSARVVSQTADGSTANMRRLMQQPLLRFLAMLTAGVSFVTAGGLLVVSDLVPRRYYGSFAVGGRIFALAAAGGLIGVALGGSLQRRFQFRTMLVGSLWVQALMWLLLSRISLIHLAGPLLAGNFCALTASLGFRERYDLMHIPNGLQETMNRVYRLASLVGCLLGLLITGILGNELGLITALLILGACMALLALLATINRHVHTASLPALRR